MPNSRINTSQIRMLTERYSTGALQGCIEQALSTGTNTCLAIEDKAEAVSTLSMAGFVRARMEQDAVSVSRAMRILGQKMRALS